MDTFKNETKEEAEELKDALRNLKGEVSDLNEDALFDSLQRDGFSTIEELRRIQDLADDLVDSAVQYESAVTNYEKRQEVHR